MKPKGRDLKKELWLTLYQWGDPKLAEEERLPQEVNERVLKVDPRVFQTILLDRIDRTTRKMNTHLESIETCLKRLEESIQRATKDLG